ncbi:hypothetical protein AB1Y20_018423 [Prymnesium parvum]|uniref:THIF-type NAD/FAD binding fold domain-containing protein n=1 Tax=Prymnesium parvum TaxID=97485 RepID=A0AB34JNC1_PRYPA
MAAESIDVKRYDRQIRLWGLETQRGLQGSRVLLLGFNGTCNELLKNLVLAGVGHACVQDDQRVAAADLEAGGVFSLSAAQLGANRAEAAVEQLKQMNPQVDLSALPTPLREIDGALLKSYHFIIGTHGVEAVHALAWVEDALDAKEQAPPAKRAKPSATSAGSSSVRRTMGKHEVLPLRARHTAAEFAPVLMAAGSVGMYGFCFFDVGCFTPSPSVAKAAADASATQPASALLYPSIASAAGVEWAALTKRVPRFYCALQLMVESADATPEELLEAKNRKLDAAGLKEDFLSLPLDDAFIKQVAQCKGVELSPICAVLGGVVAAEVIKIIGRKEVPLSNSFFFDGNSGEGVVLRLGPSFDA